MEGEYDFLGILAGNLPHCIECAQTVFGFEVVTAIFEKGQQGTFFFALRERDLKSMLFPFCSSCRVQFDQIDEAACY